MSSGTGTADIVNAEVDRCVEHEQHPVVRPEVAPLAQSLRPARSGRRRRRRAGSRPPHSELRLGEARERRGRARRGAAGRRRPTGPAPRSRHRRRRRRAAIDATTTPGDHDRRARSPPRSTPSATRGIGPRARAGATRSLRRRRASCLHASPSRRPSGRRLDAVGDVVRLARSTGSVPARTSAAKRPTARDGVAVEVRRSGARTSAAASPRSPRRSWYTSTWPSQ